MMNRIKYFLLLALFASYATCWGQSTQARIVQLNGLEVSIPGNFKTNSHVIDGMLQTSFRRLDANAYSALNIGVMDYGEVMHDFELRSQLDGIRESLNGIGYEMEPFSPFKSAKHRGYISKGTGKLLGENVRVVYKVCSFSHYFISFFECYGNDYSEDYQRIEESMRLSNKTKLKGMQTIHNNGYSFHYNADSIIAVTNHTEKETLFTFTSTDSRSRDSFMDFTFTTIEANDIDSIAHEWLPQMSGAISQHYAALNWEPVKQGTVFGQPCFIRNGFGTLVLSREKVYLSIRIGLYQGKIVYSVTQQSIDDNGMRLADIEKQFHQIEKSIAKVEHTTQIVE